jgi:RNA polymerase sigma factor (sigma-70 family)
LYVTLDGLEFIEPFHLKDLGGGLSIIDSRAIGGVELTTGGFSAEYGDRLTGVFAMRSVDPQAGGTRTSVGLSVMNARLTSEGQFDGGRGGWLLSARRGYLDLVFKLADTADSLDPHYYDLFAKAQYDLGRAGRVAVHVLDAGDALTYLDTADPSIRSRYRSSYVWANWDARLGPFRQQTVASLGKLRWRRDGERLENGSLTALVDDRRAFAVGGIRQDWSVAFTPRALLKFGTDVKQGAADYDYASEVATDTIADGARIRTWDTTTVRRNPRGTRVGLYIAPRYRPFRSVAVEVGLWYDAASHTDDAVVSPRLNLSWQPRIGTSLRGAWGKYSQSQPLANLQAQDGVDQFFAAECAEYRVLGLEQSLPRGLTGRVELYDRRPSHERPRFLSVGPGIEVFPEINWDRVRVDPERGRARGVEFLLARDEGRRVDWSAGYALAEITDRIAGRDVPRATDQRHTVSADWAYRPTSNKWRLSVVGVWHTGWPFTPQVVTIDTLYTSATSFTILPHWAGGDLNTVHGSVRGYLFAAVRNRALNLRKRQAVERDWEEDEAITDVRDLHQSPEQADEALDRADLRARLDAALDSLPERCRLVMHLRWREQMRHAEIAAMMGISVKGVEIQLARGLRTIRLSFRASDSESRDLGSSQ